MEKIAIITDSSSDLSKEFVEKYNINMLPFRIIYKDREFSDGVDITTKEICENLHKEIPTSSLPSMKDMEDTFKKLESENYTHAIIITLSSQLSGLYNAVKLASENHPTIKSYVFDSKIISYAHGAIAMECAEMIKSGASFDEIVAKLPEMRKKATGFYVVGTLEYLKKGGRIGRVAGTIAELLHIKPIISVDDQGHYYTRDKVRGRKQSISKMLSIGNELLDKNKQDVYIIHGEAEEEARKLLAEYEKHPNINRAYFGGYVSAVSGVHSGPGFIAVVFYEAQ